MQTLALIDGVLLTLTLYTTVINAHTNTESQLNLKVANSQTGDTRGNHKFVTRNAVATDPNNIRFVLGNTQLFPIPTSTEVSEENDPPNRFTSDIASSEQHHASSSSTNKIPGLLEVGADVGNTGGTHQNNVNIGGIQSFGGNANKEIASLIADKNNIGGSHQNNVAIGGILSFK